MAKKNKNIKILKPSLENRNSLCPFDFCQLVSLKITNVVYKENTDRVLTKQCPLCNRKYVHINYFKDLKKISIGKNDYYNLNLENGYIRDKFIIVSKPGSAQTVYKKQTIKVPEQDKSNKKLPDRETKQPAKVISPYKYTVDNKAIIGATSEKKIRCRVTRKFKSVKTCNICGGMLVKGVIPRKSKKGKGCYTSIKLCMQCEIVYLPFGDYEILSDVLECENVDELHRIQEEYELKTLSPSTDLAKKTNKKNAQATVRVKATALPKLNYEYEHKAKAQNDKKRQKTTKAVRQTVQVKDFVVRRSVFKCMHKEHSLQNVDAVISLVTNKGEFINTTVSAGYCPECNVYFIMESTYQMLKNRGTPLCRVSDEKAYLQGTSYVNGMKLASESLLMQYGYNVSQQEGLTETRRHKILAVLIDNKIMTKSEIISYIDFFISQRQGRSMYELAVHKWSTDRDFVEEYNSGSYTRVGISGILR